MSLTNLVDGNSIGHANHNATKLTVGGMETQAIFGVVKSIHALVKEDPSASTLVLWDGKSQWRKDVLPSYKENRTATNEREAAHKESYKKQSPFVRKALQLLGVRQMLATSAEADDLAGLLVKKLAGRQIRLVTGDKDWLQLVRPGVTWFDPIRDRQCNLSNFFEFTGYRTPEQFLDGKALVGDTSDNIPPVGGIGETGAPEFIAEFGSVQRFYDQVDAGLFVPKKKAHIRLCGESEFSKDEWAAQYAGDPSDEKAKKKHLDQWPGQGRIIFARNRRVMNLLDVPPPPKEDVSIINPTFNPEGFRALCEKLAFHSILRNFDAFIEPFSKGATHENPQARAA